MFICCYDASQNSDLKYAIILDIGQRIGVVPKLQEGSHTVPGFWNNKFFSNVTQYFNYWKSVI